MSNIKWLDENKIDKLKSPFQTWGKVKGQVKNVIVALHGFGDTAANFAALSQEIKINDVLWLFIQGPRPVPMGVNGAQWYSLFSDPSEEVKTNENLLFEFIENIIETCKISSEKIFILGFSQGAGMALHYGLKSHRKLAGIISLSGLMVKQSELVPVLQSDTPLPPIFLAHGLQDQVVLPALFFEVKNFLNLRSNIKVTSKTYKIGHNISEEEMNDIKKFVESLRN